MADSFCQIGRKGCTHSVAQSMVNHRARSLSKKNDFMILIIKKISLFLHSVSI